MQNDLILRSALLESLIYCDGLGRKSLEAVIKHINEQPTAYDVEKVVAELKESSMVYCEEYHQREGSLYIQDAVEIIRNGGKE